MKLDPQIAKAVSKELGGESIPRPDDEAFDALLERLEAEKPELATKLRSGLVHQDLGDIETDARKHSEREMRGRKLKRALVMRYDELQEDWNISKLKVLGWGSVAGLGFMALLFMGAPLIGNEEPVEAEVVQQAPPAKPKVPVVRQRQDEDPFDGLAEELEQGEQTASTFTGAKPMPGAKPAASQAAQPEQEPMLTEQPMLTEEPLLPDTSQEEEMGLGVYSAAANTEDVSQGLRAFGAGGGGANGENGAEGDPFAESDDSQEGVVGLAAYRAVGPEEEIKNGLMSYQVAPGENTGVRLFKEQSTTKQPARRVIPAPTSTTGGEGSALQVNRLMTSGVAMAQEVPQTPARPAQQRLPYKVGDSVAATLQVGVVAVDGTPLPVLARGEEGSIWQGRATLTPTGRVDITFSEVQKGARRHQVSAVAQAGDGYLGLPAQVTETTPALASDLTRGALRGLSEYVQALGQESEVRVEGNTPVISRSAPPLGANVAGSVARLFTPPEGEDQQALVRLAQVPAETNVTVVVLSPGVNPTTP